MRASIIGVIPAVRQAQVVFGDAREFVCSCAKVLKSNQTEIFRYLMEDVPMRIKNMSLLFPLVLVAGLSACDTEAPFTQVTYTADVEPIIQQHCLECHVPGQEGAEASGYVMDSFEGVMKGTKYGPVIVAGSSESSSLYRLVSGQADPSIQMPHGKEPLSTDQVKTIRLWIDKGAGK
jgi:hypothetical protein